MRQLHPDMPCGHCDVGVYSEESVVTPLARELAAAVPADRKPPGCKTADRDCVGACHFIDAINRDPAGWDKMRAIADQHAAECSRPVTAVEDRLLREAIKRSAKLIAPGRLVGRGEGK